MDDVDADETQNYVSVVELAGHLHVSKDTVYSLARQGLIPALRVGRLWRFRVPDVQAALQGSADLWAPPARRKTGRRFDV